MNKPEILETARKWASEIPNERRPSALSLLRAFSPVSAEKKAHAMQGNGLPLPGCITGTATPERDIQKFCAAALRILEGDNSSGGGP